MTPCFALPTMGSTLDARSFRGAAGFALRAALARRLPLRRHARRRISRKGRAIPRRLVRLVIRHGVAEQRASGVRLRLRGGHRPCHVPAPLWNAARLLVVPIDEFGFIPTVFRERCS